MIFTAADDELPSRPISHIPDLFFLFFSSAVSAVLERRHRARCGTAVQCHPSRTLVMIVSRDPCLSDGLRADLSSALMQMCHM